VLWQIETHPELGKRLHFFEDAPDALLAQLYQAAAGVITPSEAEGFGLPLVEAVRLGKPVLCRDLAVFRELVHDGATYFSGSDPENLAACIGQWLSDISAGQAPLADPAKLSSWREATGRLLEIVRSVAEF
jgi:glycosyltransferase involved in cell wall biosynthesis